MSMNALNTALVHLADASGALERTARPGLKDIEEAKKKAKSASEILEASYKLLSYGVYQVADAPPQPGEPLFEGLSPSPLATVQAELAPLPPELAAFDTWDEEEQAVAFDEALEALFQKVPETEDTSEKQFDPWDEAFDADRKDAWTRLQVALAREALSMNIPTEDERDQWLAGFAQPEAQQEDTPAEPEFDPATFFLNKLKELEEAGISQGLKLKAWKKVAAAWNAAFAEDGQKATDKLLAVLQQVDVSWEVPADEQVA